MLKKAVFKLRSKINIGETSKEVNGVYEVSWNLEELDAAARSGLNAFGNWDINILGTSPRWETPRMLTIGNASRFVDGSQNINWSLSEIGAAQATATVNLTGDQTVGGIKTFSSPIVSPRINIQRVNNTASGISWYNSATYTSWAEYMAQAAQTNVGPTGNITAPTGTLVTSWGLRSFIENVAGYGWTFESGTTSQTTPSIVAEIRSSDGAIRSAGDISGNTLTSRIATGTAPLTVTSTTRVANLNVATAGTADTASQATVFDTRNAVQGPQTGGAKVRFDFVGNSTDGLSDGGTYHGVMTFQQWSDASGGGTRQLGFTDNDNLWIRGSGTAVTSYGSWKLLLNSVNFSSYALPLSGGTLTGRLTSTLANDAANGGGQIYLNGATGNRIDFNTNGVAAPSFTTRSVGTKIVLYPEVSASAVDYAIGVESGTLWFSVPTTAAARQFRWYAGTTNIATLTHTGNFTASGTVTAFSDAKLKTDIQLIVDAVNKVKQLNGYTYTRIDNKEKQTGLIAQEVQKVLPEAVIEGETLSLAYGNMVGLLVEAIKEQQTQIEQQEERIKKLEATLEKLLG